MTIQPQYSTKRDSFRPFEPPPPSDEVITSKSDQSVEHNESAKAKKDTDSGLSARYIPVNHFSYPEDIAHDLDGVDLPTSAKLEIYGCAWEYTRCVIPMYTTWKRYVAFMRTIIIGIVAEYRGNMVEVEHGDQLLGLDLNAILNDLFDGTIYHSAMHKEYRAFLLITADKTSDRKDGKLFRRYVSALAKSPRQWFRMRDCDALARFSIAGALACNDLGHVSISDDQFESLSEIGNTMYDAIAFFKHRSEGETNSTFAYMPPDMRVEAFHLSRELLWALDAAWAEKPEMVHVSNFLRSFGGPIHICMRRYRFVEENLTIGRRETHEVIKQTRRNFKLWNRNDANENQENGNGQCDNDRYDSILAQSERVMFDGLKEFLEEAEQDNCGQCMYRATYGAEGDHRFGGVQLCRACTDYWRSYLLSLKDRAQAAFPELKAVGPVKPLRGKGGSLKRKCSAGEESVSTRSRRADSCAT